MYVCIFLQLGTFCNFTKQETIITLHSLIYICASTFKTDLISTNKKEKKQTLCLIKQPQHISVK